jgi:hypothetical protein
LRGSPSGEPLFAVQAVVFAIYFRCPRCGGPHHVDSCDRDDRLDPLPAPELEAPFVAAMKDLKARRISEEPSSVKR